MKSIINKIFLSVCIVVSLNACHTLEHQNFFLENIRNNQNQQVSEIDNKSQKINKKKPLNKKEMAPINAPEKKGKVKKVFLQKKVKTPKSFDFNLATFKDWSETKLIKKFGKGDFLKEEGQLKNYQYYFQECFLDIFLLKKSNQYYVSYIEKRPTKLHGSMNIEACHKEINKILN